MQYYSLDHRQYSDLTSVLPVLICMWAYVNSSTQFDSGTQTCSITQRTPNTLPLWPHPYHQPPLCPLETAHQFSISIGFFVLFHFEDVIFKITLCNLLRLFFSSLSIIPLRSIQVVDIIYLFLFIAT